MNLSIIIPVYNTPLSKLKRCFDAIEFPAEITYEVIVVDDGSEIETGEYCRDYVASHSLFRYIFQENKGVSAARNLGIAKAVGEYVLFLDADDELISEHIYQEYLSGHWDIVICDLEKHDVNRTCRMKVFDCAEDVKLTKFDFISTACQGKMNSACGRLFRRALICDNNIRFDEHMVVGEDAVFTLTAVLSADSLHYGALPIYRYYHSFNSGNQRLARFPERTYENLIELYAVRRAALEQSGVRLCATQEKWDNLHISLAEQLLKALYETTGTLLIMGSSSDKIRTVIPLVKEIHVMCGKSFSLLSKIRCFLLRNNLQRLIKQTAYLREAYIRIKY